MNIIPLFRRDVLLSVRPEYASKILSGEKTVELRRRFPTTTIGASALFYATSPVQCIVAFARIKDVRKLPTIEIWMDHGPAACISKKDFDKYFQGVKYGYAVFLEEVRRIEPGITARDLQTEFGIVPPQSYQYVKGECSSLLTDGRIQAAYRHKRRHRA